MYMPFPTYLIFVRFSKWQTSVTQVKRGAVLLFDTEVPGSVNFKHAVDTSEFLLP